MKAKIIAITQEVDPAVEASDEHLYAFGGKNAGVCYMPEDYFDKKIQNQKSALAKADFTRNSGHHSVFGHGHVTLQLSGIPKIAVMLLNSTAEYNTSEKSARYTVMKPETQIELDIYDKWRDKFAKHIAVLYPDMDEAACIKLGQENARYLISVFTPTHLTFTTSWRQLGYLIEWCAKTARLLKTLDGAFNQRLSIVLMELCATLDSVTSANHYIYDNKDRDFEFLPYQRWGCSIDEQEIFSDVFQTTYLATMAQVAQQERHRTEHYEIEFSGVDAYQFGIYVPVPIRGTDLEPEYLADFAKVAFCFPQGTLVKVLEQGRAVHFFEKCKERLCGRAQLETMLQCKATLQRFLANKEKLSTKTRMQLLKIAPNSEAISKCKMNGITCTEPCRWGSTNCFNRKI